MELIEFLDEHDIEYWTSGKNVRAGWLNIQCLFCDDESNHLGISMHNFKVHCWRCGHSTIVNVVKRIADITYKEAKNICDELSLGSLDANPPNAESYSSSEDLLSANVEMPRGSTRRFPEIHKQYLIGRGFRPDKVKKLIRRYRLRACHTYPPRYKFRIIIPVIQNRKIISFTSRSIIDDDPNIIKYMEASPHPYKENGKKIHECLIKPKHLVYNIDSVQEGSNALLVEGPMDVWKMGSRAICFFGVNFTEQQLIIVKNKKIKNMFIMFDNDRTGITNARIVARVLAPLVKKIEIITLGNVNDPGELKEEEATIIRNQLGLDNV